MLGLYDSEAKGARVMNITPADDTIQWTITESEPFSVPDSVIFECEKVVFDGETFSITLSHHFPWPETMIFRHGENEVRYHKFFDGIDTLQRGLDDAANGRVSKVNMDEL